MNEGQYTTTLDHDRGLIYVIARGEFNLELGDELITNTMKEAAKYQYNILCDVRESLTKVSLADWYYLPRRLPAYKSENSRTVKTAIIIAGGQQKRVYLFFETVANNLGLKIRIFAQEDKAIDWLKSESKLSD